MKKENKITFILFLITSIFNFISALLGFINESDMAIIFLCLGGCFLSLAGLSYEKYRKNNSNVDKESKE